MSKDYSVQELNLRAHMLAEEYIQQEFMDGDACISFVREFIQMLSIVVPDSMSEDNDPMEVALHALVHAKVFELAMVKGFEYTTKKIQAIESLKNAFDS